MPDSRVFPLPIVIPFNVFEYPGFRQAPSGVPFTVNEFNFQRVKKALHRRIVITIGPAAHAASQTSCCVTLTTLANDHESKKKFCCYI